MAGRTQRPLTLEVAKANLRLAAEGTSPSGWVRRNPGSAMIYALIGGMLLGSAPRLRRNLSRLLFAAAPLLAKWR